MRGTLEGTDGYFSGDISAATGTFSGSINVNNNFMVDSNGNMTANNGTFHGTLKGTIEADSSAWILGAGLSIGGNPTTSSGNFYVDRNGNVKMSGGINLSSGSITWGSNNPAAGCITSYQASTLITSELVSSPKLVGAEIVGGKYYATGTGASGDTSGANAAYYISPGLSGSGSSATPNSPIGWLAYDTGGAGTASEASNRVFLHTESTYPLKIESGSNMSIQANGVIYLMSPVSVVSYGTSLPSSAGVQGQIFFLKNS